MKLTFKRQMCIGVAAVVIGFVLGMITRRGAYCNIGCVIYGLLFLIHPVVPEGLPMGKIERFLMRTVGGIIFAIGLVGRFGS